MNKALKNLALALVSVMSLQLGAAGCASSTMGPGAGAADSTLKGSVNDTAQHTLNVFQQMGVQVTNDSIMNSGKSRELTGQMGETTIKVVMESTGTPSLTSVHVAASNNVVNGKKDIAQNVLDKLVQQQG
jgi:hypothetical protein